MTNKFNDIIMFQKVGTLGYETNTHTIRDDVTLQHYRIRKQYKSLVDVEYKNNIPEEEFSIFTDLNISKLTQDPEFTALHADILFSDLNLRQAVLHNGGYIGEIVKNENGKFDVYHYQDKLCACIEYKNRMKV